MGFEVHRAERADLLAEGLANLLATPLGDPFAGELVLVPAKGVERWLSQRLSHRLGHGPGREDGVCAGVQFRSPASLVAEVLGTSEVDPWAPDSLMWPVLRAIDAATGEPWAHVLSEHLGHGIDGEEGELRRGRRLAVSRRLAGLFASYAVQRPALLVDWESGGSGDGGGGELLPDLGWQPELWRRTVPQVGLPSPVRRHQEVVAQLRAGTLSVDLPSRLSLFGHSGMSASEAELVAALGVGRDVHLWLPHPSDALWRELEDAAPHGWRHDDDSHARVTHPLLAAMARDVREGQAVLQSVGADTTDVSAPPSRPQTVLGQVQSDISSNVTPTDRGTNDRSVQVHACHGPTRQVEVLREVLLGLLADDPTLEPRDIVVMCPDIEAYAPLVTGAFGLGDAVAGSHPGHQLRVMLADRSPTQTNPLLGVLGSVLDLADGRAEATRVLDLLDSDPVRRRFAFRDADLETMTRWLSASGIRWAWDQSGRAKYGLGAYPQYTWRFGLDRILAGVALSDDSRRWLGPTLALDDVSTTDISLAGRFAEAIDRLQALTAQLTGTHDVAQWLSLLRAGVEQLTDVARGDEWQVAQLHRELAALGGGASGASPVSGASGSTPLQLRLSDIRALLHGQLAGRPTRASFRTGTLTVATMTPMRSVPHRVVCLLGLDDGVFPRGRTIDGDDVLARLPRVGEPDARSRDRQLFLDAVMCATEKLVVTYTGFNEASGQPRPPSVPLREFLDVVEHTTRGTVVTDHRSQAFHTDYLEPGRLHPSEAFSFDPQAATAALAAARVRQRPESLLDLRAGAAPARDIDLGELVEAVTSPVRAFLRRRLRIDLPQDEDEISDSMPVALDGLASWQVGDRMLQEIIAGRLPEDARQNEWRRGALPPGRYGWRLAGRLLEEVKPLVEAFETATQGQPTTAHDLSVDLGDGRRLSGTVSGLYDNRLVRVGFSRLRAKQRLEAWVSLVALSASSPGHWIARVIGRDPDRDAPARVTYAAVHDPMPILAELVALRDLALSRVLPLAGDTARLYLSTADSPRPAWMVERELKDQWRKDNRPVELLTAWGHRPTWAEITAEQSPKGSDPHLFAELARRLWSPVLAAEAD